MATVTYFTAERMLDIENTAIVSVANVDGDIVFYKHNDNPINVGSDFAFDVVSEYDIEITDPDKGVILRSPNGTRWRIQVDNDGVLYTTDLS
jgi:hypothetical protein